MCTLKPKVGVGGRGSKTYSLSASVRSFRFVLHFSPTAERVKTKNKTEMNKNPDPFRECAPDCLETDISIDQFTNLFLCLPRV